jgi:signal transduction histidine kinase
MLIMLVSMVLPTVFVGGCLYYLIFTVMAERIAFPDIIARDLVPVIESINFTLLIGLPVVFVVLITWAAVLSYRFVAPLERLEEDIERIDEGDYSVRIQIAKDHDLAPIAEVINDLVHKLEFHERKD